MTSFRIFSLILLTSALMGCQVEITPIEGNSEPGATEQSGTNSAGNAADNDSVPSVGGEQPEPTPTSLTLYWSAPIERVSGASMTINDIGGYEIRYKKGSDDTYTNIVIADAGTDQYSINSLNNADDYTFEVAVFDTDGIYSDFVVASAN